MALLPCLARASPPTARVRGPEIDKASANVRVATRHHPERFSADTSGSPPDFPVGNSSRISRSTTRHICQFRKAELARESSCGRRDARVRTALRYAPVCLSSDREIRERYPRHESGGEAEVDRGGEIVLRRRIMTRSPVDAKARGVVTSEFVVRGCLTERFDGPRGLHASSTIHLRAVLAVGQSPIRRLGVRRDRLLGTRCSRGSWHVVVDRRRASQGRR
jgi:hypothetical protein